MPAGLRYHRSVKRLSASDAMFLYGESREMMMHVAGLMLFSLPREAPPDFLRRLMDEIRAGVAVHPPWNLRLRTPELLRNPLQAWVEDTEVDLEYHVRRSALPAPGDERELGILVSRLHGHSIDFHRPPWELHLIEGLEGGRFAMYIKVHHALVDGFTAIKLLVRALSETPDDLERPLMFSIPPRPRRAQTEGGERAVAGLPELMAAAREQYGATKTVMRALMNIGQDVVTPRHAPKSILNARITRNRRFATAQVELARAKAVAKAAGGTLNDVVLAMSSASLRRYLAEMDALPTAPLVAMLPVAVRASDDGGGGNSVGAILASLATTLDDPRERLAAIIASTTSAKQQLEGMSKAAIIQYSMMLTSPTMLQLLPGAAGRIRPAFNVVISNVPGPEHPLYFRGARLETSYPMSVPIHGQALNITCSSYAGRLCFGFTGCRDTVPHLQRLAVYAGEALIELERAVL